MREQLQGIGKESMKLYGFLLMAVLIAAVTVYLLLPQYKTWKIVSDRHLVLQNEVAQASADPDSVARSKQQLVRLNARLRSDAVTLNEQALESRVVAVLQELAWAHAIELDGVTPREGEQIGELKELQFDVELQGQYMDLFRMLKRLQQRLDFAVVKMLRVVPDFNADAPSLSVNLSIASYRMGES